MKVFIPPSTTSPLYGTGELVSEGAVIVSITSGFDLTRGKKYKVHGIYGDEKIGIINDKAKQLFYWTGFFIMK